MDTLTMDLDGPERDVQVGRKPPYPEEFRKDADVQRAAVEIAHVPVENGPAVVGRGGDRHSTRVVVVVGPGDETNAYG
ncbi:hypothetical protein [Streptomyces sp. NPDC093149]|uniref:hypothetical protein n=1 Tax=Streptomyces sp. NPDC093149 TaxID=3366031 RepID=UPI00382AFEA4